MAITVTLESQTPFCANLKLVSDGTADPAVSVDLVGLVGASSYLNRIIGGNFADQAAARAAMFKELHISTIMTAITTHPSTVLLDANVNGNKFRLEVSAFKVTATDTYTAFLQVWCKHSMVR